MNKSLNSKSEKTSFSDDVNIKDMALSEKIDNFMRARFDVEEIMNDPMYDKIHCETASLVEDHRMKPENSKFIRDAFSEALANAKIGNEIKEIKSEASKNNVDGLTAEWVMEWHRKKQMQGALTKEDRERENFIKGNPAEMEELEPSYKKSQKAVARKRVIQYIALPAAAVLGGFIILRSLTGPSTPEKIFSSYYEPFSALSPITRGANSQKEISFMEALGSYKSGDYKKAESDFSSVVAGDPSSGAASFYLGLSALALGDSQNAINYLSSEAVQMSEYNKDAQWYLGMAYLKKGDSKKASACFRNLSDKKGFYAEPSRKILRRLK